MVGLGLLALGPVTETESLHYHVGVAKSILNAGAFSFVPEWFTNGFAGSGEVLIVLGFSQGAEQFGSLRQYAGVQGIVGIFRLGLLTVRLSVCELKNRWRRIVTLAVVSSPVFLTRAASPKLILLPVAMTTAALALKESSLSTEKEGTEPSSPMLVPPVVW